MIDDPYSNLKNRDGILDRSGQPLSSKEKHQIRQVKKQGTMTVRAEYFTDVAEDDEVWFKIGLIIEHHDNQGVLKRTVLRPLAFNKKLAKQMILDIEKHEEAIQEAKLKENLGENETENP